MLLDDPVFGFPGGSLFPASADGAVDSVNASVETGAVMPDMVVQHLAEAENSSSETDTLRNYLSSPSPRPPLCNIAPKPNVSGAPALRAQAGLRKPAIRAKRTPFKKAATRTETSLTRTLNSCVRCRFARIKPLR
ncbi:hypothetical protein F5Y15DRAFT_295992 [Xylariaceae sp. FL0016]|nr:hypothetical protein F5Y15DRAFT_295992 [Xylariaceae sp. FL0016]